jgi:hypothetical protein
MLPIELPLQESSNVLLQLPAPPPPRQEQPARIPNPRSGYIIAVG